METKDVSLQCIAFHGRRAESSIAAAGEGRLAESERIERLSVKQDENLYKEAEGSCVHEEAIMIWSAEQTLILSVPATCFHASVRCHLQERRILSQHDRHSLSLPLQTLTDLADRSCRI